MSSPQWDRILELYKAAAALSPAEARQFLDSSSEDPAVKSKVIVMLQGREHASGPQLAGLQIGRYDVVSLIGRGSNGEVYAGRDRELNRPVALKFMLPERARVGSFVRRFMREAQAASALNHANIVTIYEVITWEESPVIVMELVEGVALRQLCGQPLPLAQVLRIGSQVLEALAAVHAISIVHRDLKPENVIVRPDGWTKVLDFGLARQASEGVRENQSSTAGLPVGTLRYMSPEQCAGEPAVSASDIFATGIILYEILTGRHPFQSDSPLDTAHAIVRRVPEPPAELHPQTPPALSALIVDMLEKNGALRPSAAQAAQKLTVIADTLISARHRQRLLFPNRPRISQRTQMIAGALGLTALALAAGLGLGAFFTKDTVREMRVDIVAPAVDDHFSFALSADGRRIAFAGPGDKGQRRVWVRELDSATAQPLGGTEGATSPFWSPDSKSLGFFADFKLKRIDLGGGQPQTLAAVPSNFAQGTWGSGDLILFSWGVMPVFRVFASGGEATLASRADTQTNQFAPRFLPGGRQYFYVANGVNPAVWMGSLDGAAPKRIVAITPGGDSAAEYMAPGWLVRVRNSALETQRFDLASGRISGEPVILARSVSLDPSNLAGAFSISASGIIAWRSGGGARRQLLWLDRAGQDAGAFGEVGDSNLFCPEISRDGKGVVTMRGPVGSASIWMQEGVRTRRLTLDQSDSRWAIWSPDGARVAFSSNRSGPSYDLYAKEVNGSAAEDELLLRSAELKRPNSWSPDGKYILYWSALNNGDLMVLPLFGDRKPQPFLSTRFNEQQGAFSPDGKWVAYQSDESGEFEVYVRPFPGPGATLQVSTGGGHSPRWRADGRELYYLSKELKMMAAKMSAGGKEAATAEVLFQTHINPAANRQQYDVGQDGRFLILSDLPDVSAEPIHLLLNWKAPQK